MDHPKDAGLAFPRKLKPKKKKSRLKPISKKKPAEIEDNKKVISERELQEHAEHLCIEYGVHFIRIPDSVLRWIYTNPDTPSQVREDANAYLNGFPDLLLVNESGNYLCLELKTPSTQSKLRASQKRFLMGKKTAIPRTKEEIKAAIEGFCNE